VARRAAAGERADRGTLSRSTLWDDDPPAGPQPLRARWDPVPPPGPTAAPRRTRATRRRSAIGWFVHHYGWRAYALPVLAALTVVAVIGLTGQAPKTASAAGPSAESGASVTVTTSAPTTVTVEKPGAVTTVSAPPVAVSGQSGQTQTLPVSDPNGTFGNVASGALPPGADFAKRGDGTFHIVPGTTKPFGDGPEHRTYTIEVEDGIETAADDALFADAVDAALSDSRSWVGGGRFTLQRIDSGTPDFRVSLTSQMTVRQPQNCGWQIQLEASCYNRLDARVFINDARWMRGAVSYNGDLGLYRVYAINHEVGHALGYHHKPCGMDGGLAPVMMQQSWSTSDDDLANLNPGGPVTADGKVCRANPFPYPRGPESSASATSSSG
jgi:hypothetical protein